jgi:hypothetical protein
MFLSGCASNGSATWSYEEKFNYLRQSEYRIYDKDFDFCTKGFSKTYDIAPSLSGLIFDADYSIWLDVSGSDLMPIEEIKNDPLILKAELIQDGMILQKAVSGAWSPYDWKIIYHKATNEPPTYGGRVWSDGLMESLHFPAGEPNKPLQLKVTVVESSNVIGTLSFVEPDYDYTHIYLSVRPTL